MKECRVPSSAETVGNTPDLLTEILIRIPAKPLLKFKCVSKQLLSIVSDPKFCFSHARHHKLRNPTANALLLNNFYCSTPEFQFVPLEEDFVGTSIPFLDYLNVPRVKILNSCNGLLLCASAFLLNPTEQKVKRTEMKRSPPGYHVDYCSSVVSNDERGYRYFVCNPTTKQFRILPFPNHERRNSVIDLWLAFDPLKSPHYKVACILPMDTEEKTCQIDVYSSETGSWNLVLTPFAVPDGTNFRSGVFCNGSVHWYSHEENSLYFDVENESFNIMPMPGRPRGNDYVLYYGESQGHLHMVVTNNPLPLDFDVLEMASDYSGWFVKYHADLQHIRWMSPDAGWPEFGIFSMLALIRAEKEEESVVVLFVRDRAMSYNLYDGTLNKLCDLEPRPRLAAIASPVFDYEGRDTFQYFESLIFV